MFPKVSSVFARIIASSNFFLVDVSWNSLKEAENMHELQENMSYVSLMGNLSFMANIRERLCKIGWYFDGLQRGRNSQVLWIQMREIKRCQQNSENPWILWAATQKVCAAVTNYMTWSLLASSNPTCVFNPCNMIQRQWLLKPEGMLKHLLLHSRLKESLQYLQVATTFFTTYFFLLPYI